MIEIGQYDFKEWIEVHQGFKLEIRAMLVEKKIRYYSSRAFSI